MDSTRNMDVWLDISSVSGSGSAPQDTDFRSSASVCRSAAVSTGAIESSAGRKRSLTPTISGRFSQTDGKFVDAE